MGYVGATARPFCWVHLESPRLSHQPMYDLMCAYAMIGPVTGPGEI